MEERAKAEEEKRQEAAREEQERQEQAQQARHAAEARQAAIQAEAERKAAALRDAVIDRSLLSINVMIGTSYGGEANGVWKPVIEDLSGTVVNHSNKTLRAIEIKVQVRDCPQCLVSNEWDRKLNVNVPSGQQRNFGTEAWRMAKNGKWYTWQLLTASECSWDWRGENTALVR